MKKRHGIAWWVCIGWWYWLYIGWWWNPLKRVLNKSITIGNPFSPEQQKIKCRNIVPSTNITFPSELPKCQDIVQNDHNDPRMLALILKTKAYRSGGSFTDLDFSGYETEDFGNVKHMLAALEEKGFITEKRNQIEILMKLYTADELRTFLQARNLKVSGNKEALANRLLENVPFSTFKRKYKHTQYEITEAGLEIVREEESDRNKAIIGAMQALKNMDYQNAANFYNAYDSKWGFIHVSGKKRTIFANYDIQRERFQFIASYPMSEIRNSDTFKSDLRACLLAGMMRGNMDSSRLRERFRLINDEPISCPGILDMYKRNPDEDMDKKDLERILSAMQQKIRENPESTLEYYISKLLYMSKH